MSTKGPSASGKGAHDVTMTAPVAGVVLLSCACGTEREFTGKTIYEDQFWWHLDHSLTALRDAARAVKRGSTNE